MSTKTLEINFCVIMGCPHADGGVAQLVEIPARRILLPECVRLAVGKTRIAIRREIGAPGKTGLALGHEQRPGSWVAAREQILVEQGADGAREKHLAGTISFPMNENGTL